tara:strand:+ start:482 stop:1303 length:822 start_codon:yes stop_codon:yes gene_type:complete
MSFLLITDTQLGMALKNVNSKQWSSKILNWSGNFDPEKKELQNLNKLLKVINDNKFDFIVHTGDIINEIDKPNDLSNYKNFYNKTKLNIHHVPGNHDVGLDPNNLSRDGLDFYNKNFGQDFYNFSWNDFELFFLNSSKFMNYSNNDLYIEQINYIDETLKSFSTAKRVIIFMHHPPYIDNKDILETGSNLIHNRDISYWMFEEKIYSDFFKLFQKHKVEYIFTGHLHINLETKFNDTKIIATSAVGVPLGNDPSGYRIINFKNGKLSYKFYKL